jgi:hypothetical protein
MGLEYSVFKILDTASKGNKIVTESADGSQRITYRRDPVMTSIAAIAAAGILIVYIDGGNGLISKSLGRVCVRCGEKLAAAPPQ